MKPLRLLGVLSACALLAAGPPHTTIYGFSIASSTREYPLEDEYLNIPSAAGALEDAAAIAALPHYAGTDGDHKLALYMRDKLQEFGFDATLETLTARVDSPLKLVVELYPSGVRPATAEDTASTPLFKRGKKNKPSPATGSTPSPAPAIGLELAEPSETGDENVAATNGAGLPFLAGSADADITAPLVYAGHGIDSDYALLSQHDIDVRGAIALIRYGSEYRGVLVRRAQGHGAAGVILYSDPADDGFARGPVFPNGPWRPSNSVQRGSLGEGITIPAVPISAANAQILLAALHGPTAPRPWTGALPVSYPIGRGPAGVHLVVHLQRKVTALWNTIGVLRGSLPVQSVVLGAHRDAWVYGLGDNGSGIVTLLEAARGLGYLAKAGWQPARTIVIAGWDGEEIGGDGVIAYLKRHGEEIRSGAIAYLSAEQNVTGPRFGIDVAAPVAGTLADATHVVPDPTRPGTTLYERWAFRRGGLPPLDEPSADDDHQPILFGTGTPGANAGFTGPLGTYHSIADGLTFARTIGDPGFVLHLATAQLYGIATLRLANADVVPYRFSAYGPALRTAVLGLVGLSRAVGVTVDSRGLGVSIGRFSSAAARIDAATARGSTANLFDRELEAARILDVSAYGAAGTTPMTFPDVEHAIRERNQSAVDLAVARARTTIERAATLLAP